ncbi:MULTISPECIES: hypothetical protein [Anaeromyxobacter]|uniref:hypothetical protein n=1 Tax=Anaeromyxobacter TaxID=161492 RepID=UPI001F573CBB|nr:MULTISPECIES: hypothetical protein [unclassified Anaeromyxobacter]
MKDGSPQNVSRVSGEIEALRNDLGALIGELDRRRHELFDLRLQAKRHPVAVIGAGVVAALVVGGLVAFAVRSRREAQRPSRRARETARALSRLMEHPDRVAAEQSMRDKILAAAGIAAGTAIAKRLVDRLVAPTPAPRRARGNGAAGEVRTHA